MLFLNFIFNDKKLLDRIYNSYIEDEDEDEDVGLTVQAIIKDYLDMGGSIIRNNKRLEIIGKTFVDNPKIKLPLLTNNLIDDLIKDIEYDSEDDKETLLLEDENKLLLTNNINISNLINLNSLGYKYLVIINNKTIKFGKYNVPSGENLYKKFSSLKVKIIVNKLLKNYSKDELNNVYNSGFWDKNVYLTSNIKASFLKIKENINLYL